jgi:hypothetical protein
LRFPGGDCSVIKIDSQAKLEVEMLFIDFRDDILSSDENGWPNSRGQCPPTDTGLTNDWQFEYRVFWCQV